MTRTLIDILRKGNQELFHSYMIRWLLDPDAEHNLGWQFLKRFADKLADKGHPHFREMVEISSAASVRTETPFLKNRYDIEICLDDSPIVIENKTKSVGEVSQLDKYKAQGAETVALGLCEVSFSLPESKLSEYPLILYRDVLDILYELDGREVKANKFAMLIEDYRAFLERELSLLELIVERYEQGSRDAHDGILEATDEGSPSDNDLRFLSLFLLEKFRRSCLRNDTRWEGAEWRTNKNQSSGVWLSNERKLPTQYSFADYIEKLCRRRNAELWFHIELKRNVFARDSQAGRAGELQLRCRTYSPEWDNQRFLEELKDAHTLTEEEHYYRKSNPSQRYSTFYVARRDLSEKDLLFNRLEKLLTSFHEEFGNFNP